jgi:hypothetical protein
LATGCVSASVMLSFRCVLNYRSSNKA